MSKTQNGLTTTYLYHGQNEIGAIENDQITELRVLGNTLGAEVGAAIALELQGSLYAPIHDPFGNVMALITAQGDLAESTRYTAFGQMETLNLKYVRGNSQWLTLISCKTN
jgi:hypothetical protein